MQLVLTLRKRLLLLLLTCIIGYFITSVIGAFLMYKFGTESTPAMRILTVLQDVFAFIAPAIATACLVCRQPAQLLCVDRSIRPAQFLIAACVLLVSIPAMNYMIWLNQQLPLPDGLAQSMRSMEDSAQALINTVIGPPTIPNLMMALLIVGLFAGLSEELLFRGALQRLLSTGGVNVHVAIWIAAAIFSALHMQFYGFVPRLLLGAYFGYLLLWSGSLWTPILLHALNNMLYIVGQYMADGQKSAIDGIGAGQDYLLVACSVAMTAIGIYLLRRQRIKNI